MNVQVKKKVTKEMVAAFGKRKALFRMEDRLGVLFTVSVVQYEGIDYFLVEYNDIPKECMPL